MTKNLKILLIALGVVVVGGLVTLAFQSPEPVEEVVETEELSVERSKDMEVSTIDEKEGELKSNELDDEKNKGEISQDEKLAKISREATRSFHMTAIASSVHMLIVEEFKHYKTIGDVIEKACDGIDGVAYFDNNCAKNTNFGDAPAPRDPKDDGFYTIKESDQGRIIVMPSSNESKWHEDNEEGNIFER